MTSFGKRVFANEIKDLEMRSFWITQVDLKSNGKCPLKGQKRRGEVHVKIEAELGVMQSLSKELLEPPKAGGGKGFSPRAFGRSLVLLPS